jgi:hypothetical protein
VKKIKRRRRAQPRKATPPVALRGERGRIILLVDEEATTSEEMTTLGKSSLFVRLEPGLHIKLSSRRIAKMRYPLLIISAAQI